MSRRDWTKVALFAVIVLLLVLASGGVGFAAGWQLSAQAAPSPIPGPNQDAEQRMRVFWEAWDVIAHDFSGPLDTQKMVYGAINGMVRSLGDPYTLFMEPAEATVTGQDLEGSFAGIGASVDLVDGRLVIVEPLPGSPAQRAGLLAGDVLLEVDGKPLDGLDLMQAIALIRGPQGSQVHLLVQRPGTAQPLEIGVTRDKIELPTVSSRVLDDGMAYIQITEFNGQAADRVKEALQGLAPKPRAVILDLRGNPGGYLQASVQVASQFIASGVIVTEKDRNGRVTPYRAEKGGLATDLPVAVLVDGNSASAAEIVAGALQDTGRGVLIGQKTFGKGSVQIVHTLSDGSSLRVSVARWYTPLGHQIDGKGLTPDITVAPPAGQTAGQDPVLDRAVQYLSEHLPAPDEK